MNINTLLFSTKFKLYFLSFSTKFKPCFCCFPPNLKCFVCKLTILALALVEEKISNERLRYVLNVHKYDITKLLRNLCHNGLLTSEGLGRGTIYRLVTRHNT